MKHEIPGHPAVETVVEYNYPMLVNVHRRVRKLLEMCSGGLSILCDSRCAWELGRFDESKYDPSRMDVCTVEFKGHHHWQMSHLGTVLMDVRYGNPSLPQAAVDMNVVRAALAKQFGGGFDASTLCDIVNIAVEGHHGAVVVISKDAAVECERLVGKMGIHRHTVRLRCVTEPDSEQKLLLHRLGITLPKRLGSQLMPPQLG